jgi:hypothetical protein
VRRERAVWSPRDDVGERAAAVDPELPLIHLVMCTKVACAFGQF